MIKILLKSILSIQFTKILDKNGDGKISFSELKNATLDDWGTIAFEVLGKVLIAYEIIEKI